MSDVFLPRQIVSLQINDGNNKRDDLFPITFYLKGSYILQSSETGISYYLNAQQLRTMSNDFSYYQSPMNSTKNDYLLQTMGTYIRAIITIKDSYDKSIIYNTLNNQVKRDNNKKTPRIKVPLEEMVTIIKYSVDNAKIEGICAIYQNDFLNYNHINTILKENYIQLPDNLSYNSEGVIYTGEIFLNDNALQCIQENMKKNLSAHQFMITVNVSNKYYIKLLVSRPKIMLIQPNPETLLKSIGKDEKQPAKSLSRWNKLLIFLILIISIHQIYTHY